jgi:hypothetical protein
MLHYSKKEIIFKIRLNAGLCLISIALQYIVLLIANASLFSNNVSVCGAGHSTLVPYINLNFHEICMHSSKIHIIENFYYFSFFIHISLLLAQIFNTGFSIKLFFRRVKGWPIGPILALILFLYFVGWLEGTSSGYKVRDYFEIKFWIAPFLSSIFESIFVSFYSKVAEFVEEAELIQQ